MLPHTSCHMEQGIGDDLSTSVALRVKAICLSAYSNNYLLSRKSAMHSLSHFQYSRPNNVYVYTHMVVKDPRDIYRQQIIY